MPLAPAFAQAANSAAPAASALANRAGVVDRRYSPRTENCAKSMPAIPANAEICAVPRGIFRIENRELFAREQGTRHPNQGMSSDFAFSLIRPSAYRRPGSFAAVSRR
jgi:hypothetical protein